MLPRLFGVDKHGQHGGVDVVRERGATKRDERVAFWSAFVGFAIVLFLDMLLHTGHLA